MLPAFNRKGRSAITFYSNTPLPARLENDDASVSGRMWAMAWEVRQMGIITRRSLAVISVAALAALYAGAAWRAEQMRMRGPGSASCAYAQCVPQSASFSAMR